MGDNREAMVEGAIKTVEGMPPPSPLRGATAPVSQGRIGRGCGNPRHFTAPKVRPRTSWRWLNQPSTRIGAMARVEAAESFAQNSPSGLE